MARKKKELPLLEKVTITDVAAEGKAIAKVLFNSQIILTNTKVNNEEVAANTNIGKVIVYKKLQSNFTLSSYSYIRSLK